jgi:hypothetical protein
MFMSRSKSLGASLAAARLHLSHDSRGRLVVRGIALIALGIVWFMDDVTSTATYVTVLTLGWLLLIGALTARRGTTEPSKCLVRCEPVRVHPVRRRWLCRSAETRARAGWC